MTEAHPLLYCVTESPVGPILLAGDGERLHRIAFSTGRRPFGPEAGWARDDTAFAEARRQLATYFAGGLTRFDLPYALSGTDFRQRVWRALATIPHGETRSYGWLARAIGDPKAVRAVGAANGANPLPILLPCHRVIGADGSLTGFGGGIETKRALLDLEGARSHRPEQPSLL
ncbi:methylated-DNA--[protein]-cysteine S-methyltransferase [Marivibrio halodurans]|uniref:Methylated-DNA--protein-cysteine methyltransferase n=1 Tax=Marivibrio halodurans TaxID=2039722 RepID=A0A8J7V2G8_9PROT|nr:methylated-DNA--[protein]-cysteine S-methyltransferase [Marivibrio halodurans]MBP5856887.1 methylated-DNA--[protein]-cysteine S-methyltransferase [Marivibrio halodurans]